MKRLLTTLVLFYAQVALSATTVPVQLLNPAGSTAGQAIVSTGASSAPAWGGVPVGGLAAIAANSVIANATNASAVPTAITVAGCNGAAQALQWTNGAGFGCNSNIATSGANSNITGLSGLTSPVALPGVTNGSNAAAGTVGQTITSGPVTGVTIAPNAATNIASITLTPGNWIIWGNVQFTSGSATIGVGGYSVSISSTSGSQNTAITNFAGTNGVALTTGASPSKASPIVVVNVTSNTTYFIVGVANLSASATANGFISALRIH